MPVRTTFLLCLCSASLGLGCADDSQPPTTGQPPATGGTQEVPVEGVMRQVAMQTPCPFEVPEGFKEGTDIVCGTVQAPANPRKPDGLLMTVAFFRVPAKQPTPSKAPLVTHFGGPGSDGEAEAAFALQTRDTVGQDRDLIAIGQRGTTYTATLEASACADEPAGESLEAVRASSRACRQHFEGLGIDPLAFSTASAVGDLEALRIALQVPKLSFYGVSYGTNYALEYMRRFPAQVERAVIDSVYPPNADRERYHIDQYASVAHAYLTKWRTDCQASAACRSAFGGTAPNLAQDWQTLVAKAASEPLEFIEGAQFDASTLLDFTREGMKDLPFRSIFVGLVYGLARADGSFTDQGLASKVSAGFAALRQIGQLRFSDEEFLLLFQQLIDQENAPEVLNFLLNCTELFAVQADRVQSLLNTSEFSYLSPTVRGVLVGKARFDEAACSGFKDIFAANAPLRTAVISARPTMVYSPTFDAATPLPYAVLAKASLSQSRLIEVPCAGHGAIFAPLEQTPPRPACAASVLRQSLDLDLQAVDASCLCP